METLYHIHKEGVKGAFGRLNGRLRILFRKCESNKETVKLYGLACVVFQNLCIERGDLVPRKFVCFFFLSGFSFTDSDNSQDSRGREGIFIYSTLPLPPTHEHSDIYVQLCT